MKPNNGRYKNVENIPEIGDVIYIPTALHVYRGMDDVEGGKALVTGVREGISGGEPALFVSTKVGNSSHNWAFLEKRQADLKERFGEDWAYNDPDNRPEFNCPDADWRPVSGERSGT